MGRRPAVAGHIQANGKTYMVQKSFKQYGVARMYRSSGTSDPVTFAAIKNMLEDLAEMRTPEARTIVQRLDTGQLSFLEALQTYKKEGRKGIVRHAEIDAPITAAAFQAWLNTHDVKPTTRKSYMASYRTMEKFIRVADTMKTLPTVLKRYRDWCVANDKLHRTWDIALAVAQAWVRGTMGDDSTPYLALRKLDRFDRKSDARTKKYFTPRDIMDVCARMPESVGGVFWSMAVYGCGPKEYLEDGWQVEGPGLHIFGEKHEHRDRLVPLLPAYPPVTPPIHFNYHTLHHYVFKASRKSMTPYAARNAYPRWLGEAGVPWHRVKMYQGHAESEMTDTYAMHHVTEKQWKEDANKLQLWIQAQLKEQPASTDTKRVPVKKIRQKKTA